LNFIHTSYTEQTQEVAEWSAFCYIIYKTLYQLQTTPLKPVLKYQEAIITLVSLPPDVDSIMHSIWFYSTV